MKKIIVGLLGALALGAAFAASDAQATCTIDSACKEQFGCEPCQTAWALGITGTSWQNRTATDNANATTTYRTRRTSAGNSGGLVVEAQAVGSTYHTVYGSIGCTNNQLSGLIDMHQTGTSTVFCPSGTTPLRADTNIKFPDNLCPWNQLCSFH